MSCVTQSWWWLFIPYISKAVLLRSSCGCHLQFLTLPGPHAGVHTAAEENMSFPISPLQPERYMWWGCLWESSQSLSSLTQGSSVYLEHTFLSDAFMIYVLTRGQWDCLLDSHPLALSLQSSCPNPNCVGDRRVLPHIVLGLPSFLSALQQIFHSCLSNKSSFSEMNVLWIKRLGLGNSFQC